MQAVVSFSDARKPLILNIIASEAATPMMVNVVRYLLNFLYPPRCAACGERLGVDSTRRVCQVCLNGIERVPEPVCEVCGIPLAVTSAQLAAEWCRACAQTPPHFGRARAITRYRPGVAEEGQIVPSMIRRHKYGLDQSLSCALAECIGDGLPLEADDYDLVIPVPLHRARLHWRGFNQSALLGAAVARRFSCPLDVNSLRRVRATQPQTQQDHRRRRMNVRGAFAVTRPRRIANRRILLIDDVMTTGATVDECARSLLAAGARRVDVLTLARAV